MAFEDRLTASFRGVEFLLEEADGTGGRRAIPHAYPKQESGWTEDHGAVLTEQSISARVVGPDYVDLLETLLAALNEPGPGELIHPWWGVQQVQVGQVKHKFSINTDQTATVTFDCYEAGKQLFHFVAPDTAQGVMDAADAAAEAAAEAVEDEWDLGALEGMGEMIDQYLDDLFELTSGLPGLPGAVGEWTDRLFRLKDSVGGLLAYPGRLAFEVTGVLMNIRNLVYDPIRALSVYDQVRNRWTGLRAELAATGGLSKGIKSVGGLSSSVPSLVNASLASRAKANTEIFAHLIQVSATVGKSQAMADAQFEYGEQANTEGLTVAKDLAVLAEASVERGDSETWRALRALRAAVVADTRERSVKLPQLRRVRVKTTQSAALIAWRETGDAEQRDALVSRNRLRYSAFIRPDQTLEVVDG